MATGNTGRTYGVHDEGAAAHAPSWTYRSFPDLADVREKSGLRHRFFARWPQKFVAIGLSTVFYRPPLLVLPCEVSAPTIH